MAYREKKEIVIAENRDFKGVWIPERLYLTREFTPNEKFLLIEIYSLTKKKSRECFANNKHFADFVGLKENTVQKMMLKFENAGYIKRDYEYREGTKEIERRTIKLTQKFYESFINESEKPDFSADDMENNPDTDGFESMEEVEKNPQGDGLKVGDKYSSIKYNSSLSNTDSSNIDNSFSKEKVNSNSPQGMCNSFSREKKDTRTPKQKKPLSEKELEQANCKMPYRASGIAYNLTENRDLSNNVFKFFEYFLDERKKHTGNWHIPLSDTTLAKVVATLIEDIKVDRGDYEDTYFSLVIDEPGNNDYEEVVDQYFKTKFKSKVDYSIVHFTQENVLINIMNHCGKENWCMSV